MLTACAICSITSPFAHFAHSLAAALGSSFTPASNFFDLFLREVFNADQCVSRLADSDQFIEFNLYRRTIPILRVLNEETIRNVTIVVPVLMISCHVSEY